MRLPDFDDWSEAYLCFLEFSKRRPETPISAAACVMSLLNESLGCNMYRQSLLPLSLMRDSWNYSLYLRLHPDMLCLSEELHRTSITLILYMPYIVYYLLEKHLRVSFFASPTVCTKPWWFLIRVTFEKVWWRARYQVTAGHGRV